MKNLMSGQPEAKLYFQIKWCCQPLCVKELVFKEKQKSSMAPDTSGRAQLHIN